MKFVRSVSDLVATVVGFAYLATLSVLIVYLVVAALAALQVRNAMESGETEDAVAAVATAMSQIETERELILDELDRSDTLGRVENDLFNQYHALLTHLTAAAPDDALLLARDDYDLSQVPGFREFAAACAEPARGGRECIRLVRFNALLAQRDRLIADGAGERFEEARREAFARIVELEQGHPLAAHFSTLRFFEQDPLFDALLKMPTQVSVLILTIVMGALGSIISMTWSFVRQDSQATIRRFLVMPLVGCTSAFVVYVFLKAGQMTITSDDGSASLSPFFVSFVGIVSGLVSERAYTRVADIGSGFFAARQEEARWGIGLQGAMEDAGLDAAGVAAHLGLTQKEVEAYVAEEAPVPVDRQRLLAACLRRGMRELFTDVPPEEFPQPARRAAALRPEAVPGGPAAPGEAAPAADGEPVERRDRAA